MKKFIKSLCLIIVSALVIFGLISCDKENESNKKTNAPVFSGVEDITIEKGTQFLPWEGVSITDAEDGNINLSSKNVSVNARSVNVNVEGTYEVIYTAYDSDGNETQVTRKVTVVYVDKVAPELYGASDTTIIVGDDTFTPMKDVSAVDIIDGTLTDQVVENGSVDVWTPGTYTLNYSVKDNSGNERTATRIVTVSEGNFSFNSDNELTFTQANNIQEATVSGGTIMSALGDFSLVKVVLTLSATSEVKFIPTLKGATTSKSELAVQEEKEYVIYFRIKAALENAKLSLPTSVTIKSAKISFAESGDNAAPVITRKWTNDIYLPIGVTKEEALTEILRGVSAQDEIEGNLTSKLSVDISSIDLNKAGSYVVDIKCQDTAGNVAVEKVNFVIAKARDTHAIEDPEFNETDNNNFKLADNGGATLEFKDGTMVVTTKTAGGWASADSPYLKNVTTDTLTAGHYYMFKFDVKAEKTRAMIIRAGLELWASPWMDDFYDVNGVRYEITTEYQTFYYIFYVSSATSSVGSKNLKFELQLGSIDWNDAESNNVVTFDNCQFYLLSNDTNAPEITPVEGVTTKFAVGSTLPDLTGYVTCKDVEDGLITITKEMIDTSKVDMSKAGKYPVIYTVKDSDGDVATYSLEIEVLASADTTGPVITVADAVYSLINQTLPVKEGTNLTDIINSILNNITIVDNVDGTITPNISMVDFGGLNYTSANTGSFTVKISCKDSSGNASNTPTIVITVVDGTAPVLVGVKDFTTYKGFQFDPTKGVVAVDGTDGIITLTTDNIKGFEAFMDASGKVVGEAGEYQVSYSVKDQAGNEVSKTAKVTVEPDAPTFVESNAIDLLSTKVNLEGSKSKIVYNADGTATISYAGPEGWYASAIKLKYLNIALEKGVTYKLVIEAKAVLPRGILIYFVDSAGKKVDGFLNENTWNRLEVDLMNDYYVYEYIFTPTSDACGACTMEIQFDTESGLVNSTNTNTLDFKQIKIVSSKEKEEGTETPEEATSIVMLDDFEGYSEKSVTTVWTKRNCGAQQNTSEGFEVVEDGANHKVKFTYASDGQYILKYLGTMPTLTDDLKYIRFRADVAEGVDKVQIWVYWAGGQNGLGFALSDILASDGYCYVELSKWNKTASQITGFAIGFNYKGGSVAYFDDISFVATKPQAN